ncbi:hypothetical protein CEXT_655281 [Caerostris extrusa]|uniref:Uncharacterized protein n=1 Tax=Caerostris extrusa TaxID=172846 RepID=A0AAV4QFX4_CAEEX|nr:hypothetical protein CEXT_655281 [Caerostris extrusa]
MITKVWEASSDWRAQTVGFDNRCNHGRRKSHRSPSPIFVAYIHPCSNLGVPVAVTPHYISGADGAIYRPLY